MSDSNGDTIAQVPVKGKPRNAKWGKAVKGGKQELVLSMVVDGKSLLLYYPNNSASTCQMSFPVKYGSILDYLWMDGGLIALSFSGAYLIVITTGISLDFLTLHR